jgi:hypothetical protein
MKTLGELINKSTFNAQYQTDEWAEFSRLVRSTIQSCKFCGATKNLNVHHPFYDYKRKLWEYETHEVMVLCKTCHRELHDELQNFRKHVFCFMNPMLLRHINACLLSGLTHYEPQDYVLALIEFTKNERLVRNHAAISKLG